MNIDRFRNYLLGEGYATTTIRKYSNLLKGIEEQHKFDIDQVDDNYKIAEFLHKLDRTRVAKNNLAKAINCYLKFRNKDYRLKLKHHKGTRDTWIPTKEQKEKLLSVNFSNLYYTTRNKLLLRILFEAGLRAGVASRLRFKDIKKRSRKGMTEYYIMVRRGKGGKDRRVPISKDLFEDIEYYESHYRGSEYIFDSNRGPHISDKTVRQIFYKAAEKTEDEDLIENFHPHSCRHYRAIELLEEDINLKSVRDFLGHESLETTQQYLEAGDDLLYQELRSKDKYFNKKNKTSGGFK